MTFQFTVEQIDHLAESSDGATIGVECESRQLCEVFIIGFDFVGFRAFDASFGADIGELVIESLKHLIVGCDVQSQDQSFADESHAVVDAVEPQYFFDSLFDAVCDCKERHIGWGDEAGGEQVVLNVSGEILPEGASGLIEHDEWHEVAFAGLNECESFEGFIECAETPGAGHDGVHFLDEHQFAGEEVFEADKFGVAGDDGVGLLLEGQEDIEPHGHITPGTPVSGFHDAGPGTGDDHPAFLGHASPELFSGVPCGVIGCCSCGAEDADFAVASPRGEDFEGVAEFPEGAAENFEVAAGCVIA